MMNTLLESRPVKQKSRGGTIFSVLFHSALLFFAVFATARAGVRNEKEDREQKVNFVKMKKEPPPPVVKKEEPPPPPKVKKQAPAPKVQKMNPLPPAPKAEIAPPKGFKGGSSTGTEGSEGTKEGAAAGSAIDTNKNYAEFEVERQVQAISGTNL